MSRRCVSSTISLRALACLIAGMAVQLAPSRATHAEGQSGTNDSRLGFVVSHFRMALSRAASETGACPRGMTLGPAQIFAATPEGQRREGESDADYSSRIERGALSVIFRNGKSLCNNPESGGPDPSFHTVTGRNAPAEGIDLDGQVSHLGGPAAPGTCPHDDFRGMNGEEGIDNQFFRLVGCSNAYQPTGNVGGLDTSMYAGEWGILITLRGVDDLTNDADVEVGIYASADPIQLSPTREPLTYATYAADQDPRFRAVTHGRIVHGVLTTDPVSVRFHYVVNGMFLERPLDRARLRMTIKADKTLDGILAGYTPLDAMYDMSYGFRNATDETGKPANERLRVGSAIGASRVLGHTCNGAYYAMQELADGDRDPKTGRCSSISTQYRVQAIPAFVVDAPVSHGSAAPGGR